MIRSLLAAILLSLILAAFPPPETSKTLNIYAIDVEGGKATLVVGPSGESMLIDSGWLGDGAQRDAARIMAAIEDARLQQIDHLITTHWHRDHVGAMASLARQFPIREFIDHGPNVQRDPQVDAVLQSYSALYSASKHSVVKPKDTIPIAGMDVRVVASAGELIQTPLPEGGSPNPYCAATKKPDAGKGENPQSIGVHVTFGQFRLLDLADLSADEEFELMCPNNPFGSVDLFMVSHHGQPNSNLKVLVHAIEPRAAIMNNGPRKGGQPEVMKVLYTAPGLQNLWQLHFSSISGEEYNAPGLFIANLADEPHNGPAHWLKVSAREDGAFVVTNGRNGFSKAYPPAARRTARDRY